MKRYPINPYQNNPQLSPNEPEKSDNKLYWILGIIFIVSILGLGYILFSVSNSSNESSDIGEEIDEQLQSPQETSKSLILCGNDIDCFIEQTQECNLANLTYDFGVNLFGWVQNHTYYYEIREKEGDNCVYYTRIENVYGEYDEETRQVFLDNNMSQSEIDQQEKEINDILKTTIGKDGTCSTNQEGLTRVFVDLKSGDFSFDSNSSYNCEGELYSQSFESTN